MTAQRTTEIAGVVYFPIDRIMTSSPMNRGDGLPGMTPADWRLAGELKSLMPKQSLIESSDMSAAHVRSSAMSAAKSMSWMPYLCECALNQARSYAQATGHRMLVLENLAFGKSYVSDGNPDDCVAYWSSLALAQEISRGAGGDFKVGIRLRGGHDDWAVDIACRAGLSFVVCEDWTRDSSRLMSCRSKRMAVGKKPWPEIYGTTDSPRRDAEPLERSGLDGIVYSGSNDIRFWNAADHEVEGIDCRRPGNTPKAIADFGGEFDRELISSRLGRMDAVLSDQAWDRNGNSLEAVDPDIFEGV